MRNRLYKLERKLLYKELEPLFKELSTVRYAVVKGEVLSQQIYGVPDRRRSSDIDILIDKKNVKFLEEQLCKLGFEQKLIEDASEIRRNRVLCMAYSHQIPSYYKDKFGFRLNVDVNYDIFWGEYEGKRCSIDEFLSDTLDMEIYGVTVKTLPIEKAFVQLILHHYKEMNSLYHLSQHNTIRTDMFRDIYDLLINHKRDLNSDIILSIGDKYCIGKYIHYMIYYTGQVFRHQIITLCLKKMIKHKDEKLIMGYGLNSKEQKKWSTSFASRLDNDNLWYEVEQGLSENDKKKIESCKIIFEI
jgi:hypothetical protein